MTDTMTSKNIVLSSWDTLYNIDSTFPFYYIFWRTGHMLIFFFYGATTLVEICLYHQLDAHLLYSAYMYYINYLDMFRAIPYSSSGA
jgi:hypothetical protein